MKSPQYIGKGIDRVDGKLKVTGKAGYAVETPVANVTYAVIVGSTIAKGRIASLDTQAAMRVPGVLAVLSHENAPKLPGLAAIGHGEGRVVQVLQDDTVHYPDQPIALVVADTLENARQAASLVVARYEAVAPKLQIELELGTQFTPKPMPKRPPWDSNRGDFDHGFAGAPVRIDAVYTTQIQVHNPMELHGTIAVWQGDDHLTLYDATQGIFGVRSLMAKAFDLPKENVRVISKFLGGGFGCKGSPWSHVYLAALAARATGRAVKLAVSRPQMFAFVGYRPRTIQHVSLGANRDGTLVAVRHELVSHTSTFDEFTESSAILSRILYTSPNARTSHRLVKLDLATPTFTRAPGYASGSFAIESAMDELAYALKMDPLALRLKNYAETDPEEKRPFSSKSLRECYRRAAERFGWGKRKPAPRSMRDGHALLGWGLATATYPAHQVKSSALARMRADGTVLVLAGTQDIGTGTYTIMTQIAADALGVPIDSVRFDLGDTTFPETPLSAGSLTAASTGSAVQQAALGLRRKIAQLASGDPGSPLHGLDPAEIDASGGMLIGKGGKVESHVAVLKRHGLPEIEVAVTNPEHEDRKDFSAHAFGCQLAEVKVDEDLGEIRVSRVVSAFAAGKVLNAKTARSQLLGGVVWGIGLALLEHGERDPRTGRMVTRDLADYHVPVNADVPAIDVTLVDEDDPHVAQVGAKGMGEIGIVGVGAAIANAVYHATGKRVRDLPITLDKLI